MTLNSGSVLGRYRLEALLGTGGMASVWRARDERLGRSVAVKILSETLALDRDYVERFKREARIAASLSHPNLVGVFDFDVDDGRPYLVSEYVDGGTLAERIESGAAIDAGRLARQLLGALDHIHSAGVIHRDVKPANVLIDPDGHSRLTDFGVAQPTDASRLTETGKVVGTLAYMAPEVRAGEAGSKRSDLYSCGVVLRECLGEAPPQELSTLVERLTAEDPAARPRSAAAALKLLDSAPEAATLAVTQPLPRTEPPTERMARSAPIPAVGGLSRPRAAAALAALLAVAVAGFAFAQTLGDSDSPRASAVPKKSPKPTTVTVAAQPPTTQPTTTAPPTCAELEEQERLLKEQRKEAEEAAGDDPLARQAIEEQFKQREETLKEQLKACDEDEYSGSGNGPDGEGPPGQVKKYEGSDE